MRGRSTVSVAVAFALSSIVLLSVGAAGSGYGSHVAQGAEDAGLALSSFVDDRQLCYVDDDGDGSHGTGEPIYAAASCGSVSAGDLRLAPAAGMDAGTQVGDDGDAGNTLAAFDDADVAFEDANVDRSYDGGEILYVDADGDGEASPGDLRLTPTAGAAAGTFVTATDTDAGSTLTGLADLEVASWRYHDTDGSGDWSREDTAYVDADGSGDVSVHDVRLGPIPADDAEPPAITITSPGAGEAFEIGEEVSIEGTASPGDHEIDHVRAVADGEQLDVDGQEDWRTVWTPDTVGTQRIVAVAADTEGEIGRDVLHVEVTAGQGPGVTIDVPKDGAEVQEDDEILIRGTAQAGDAPLDGVQVAVDGRRLDTSGQEVWTARWTPGGPGVSTIEATAQDEVGATGTVSLDVNVTEADEPTRVEVFETAIVADPMPVSVGETVSFTLESRGGDTARVDWWIDGDAVQGDRTLEHTFDEAGWHTVQAEATSRDRSTDTSELRIPVAPARLDVDLEADVSAGPLDPATGQAQVDLQATVDGDRELSYAWSADGQPLAKGADTTGTLDGPGLHRIALEASDDEGAALGWLGSVSVGTEDDLHPVPVGSLQQFGELVGLSAALPGDVDPRHVIVALGAHPEPSDWSDGLVYRAEVATDEAGEPVVGDLDPYEVRDRVTEPLVAGSEQDPPADAGRVGLSPVVMDGQTVGHILSVHLDLDPLDVGEPMDVSKMRVLIQADGDAPRCQGGCLIDALEDLDPGPAFPMGAPTDETDSAMSFSISRQEEGAAEVARAVQLPAGHGVPAMAEAGTSQGELQAEVTFAGGDVMWLNGVAYDVGPAVLGSPASGGSCVMWTNGDEYAPSAGEDEPSAGEHVLVSADGCAMWTNGDEYAMWTNGDEYAMWTNGDEYLRSPGGIAASGGSNPFLSGGANPFSGGANPFSGGANPFLGARTTAPGAVMWHDAPTAAPVGGSAVGVLPPGFGGHLAPDIPAPIVAPTRLTLADGSVMGGWGDVGRSSPATLGGASGPVGDWPTPDNFALASDGVMWSDAPTMAPDGMEIWLPVRPSLEPVNTRYLATASGDAMWSDAPTAAPAHGSAVGILPPGFASVLVPHVPAPVVYPGGAPTYAGSSVGDVLIAARGGPAIGSTPQEDIAAVTIYEADTGRIVAEAERPGDRPPLDADAWALDVPRSVGHGDQAEIQVHADPALPDDAEVGARLMFSADGGETWEPTHAGLLDAGQLETLTVDGSRLEALTGPTENARFGLLVNDGLSTALIESDPVLRPPAPTEIDVVRSPVDPDPDRPALGATLAGTIPPEVGPRGAPLHVGETTRVQVLGATDAGDPVGPEDLSWTTERLGIDELEEGGVPNGTMLHPDDGEPVSLRHVLRATGVGVEATDATSPTESPFVTDARGNGEAYELAFSDAGVYRLQVTATDPDTGLETTRNATMVVTPEIDTASLPGEDGFVVSGSGDNQVPLPGVAAMLAMLGAVAVASGRDRGGRK